MTIIVNDDALAGKSRIALVHLMNLQLRLMERWRRMQVELTGSVLDCEATLILMAIVTIGTERLLKTATMKDLADLSTPIDWSQLRKANLSSIAATTGLNRELVRRRVGRLEEQGLVIRDADGGVKIAKQVGQHPAVRKCVASQLHSVAQTCEQLRIEGLISRRQPNLGRSRA